MADLLRHCYSSVARCSVSQGQDFPYTFIDAQIRAIMPAHACCAWIYLCMCVCMRFELVLACMNLHVWLHAFMQAGDQIKRRRDESALEEEEQTDRILKLQKHCKRFRLMMPCLNFVVTVIVVIFLAPPVLVFVAVVFIDPNLHQLMHNFIPGLSRLSEKSILSTPACLWVSQSACRLASCRLVELNAGLIKRFAPQISLFYGACLVVY